MNKQLKPLVIILVTLAVLAAAYFAYSTFSARTSEKTAAAGEAASGGTDGTDAPDTSGGSDTAASSGKFKADDFTVYDPSGNAVKLSSFAGKPILLNFWASWCGPCQSEMPDLDAAYKRYGDKVQFVMVCIDSSDTAADAKQFIADKEYSFPVYYDTDTTAASVYGIRAIPTTFFLTSDGTIQAQNQGMMDADQIESYLSALAG